ncbi:unnamed protein product [Blepharisma stoltei]|uniref:Uncharacterized protein n=1 Tax=Blepharisma stoltei TaxID=1481888 RepID=A0AAU9K226_9CILI|nr:unnamed protein product [Blepharisma stoltei]
MPYLLISNCSNNSIYKEMGNYLIINSQKSSISNFLSKPIDFSMQVLTKWFLSDILQFYKRYISYHWGKGFHLSRAEFKRLARVSPISGMEDVVFNYFRIPGHIEISILEIFASVIVYGNVEFNEKIRLAMYIFDLDGNKYLTRDEVYYLCEGFIKGIGSMTRGPIIEDSSIATLADTCFAILKKSVNMKICGEDLKTIVILNDTLYDLLHKNVEAQEEKKSCATEETPRAKTPLKLRGRGRGQTICIPCDLENRSLSSHRKRDISTTLTTRKSSFSKKRANNFSITVGKQLISRFEVSKFYEIFKTVENINGYATAISLHNALLKSKDFASEAGSIPLDGQFLNFTQMLAMVFRNASISEIKRLVRFINPELEPETPNKEEKTKRLSFNSVKFYPQLFETFEKDREGYIQFKALKTRLGGDFHEENLRYLFEQYRVPNKGIDLYGFIRMFIPNSTHIGQDVLNKLSA